MLCPQTKMAERYHNHNQRLSFQSPLFRGYDFLDAVMGFAISQSSGYIYLFSQKTEGHVTIPRN